jgi:hypothetical protein
MTRWHPNTCDKHDQGLGCILDVSDWGADGRTPTGTVVQLCARHASLAAAHKENVVASDARRVAETLPSMASQLVKADNGTLYLPPDAIVMTYPGGVPTPTIPSATVADQAALASVLAPVKGA